MMRKIFVTGTDTEVGKTLITAALINKARQQKMRVDAIKPVAAGCEKLDAQWRNEDALILLEALADQRSYSQVNPIALKSAIAPHIAARLEGIELSVERLINLCAIEKRDAELLFIEGAGGWLVPLNDNETLADFAAETHCDVLLVVGMRLGCINHALLTAESIRSRGLKLAGWVANGVQPQMTAYQENLATLKAKLDAPLLGEVPYLTQADRVSVAADCVTLEPLLR